MIDATPQELCLSLLQTAPRIPLGITSWLERNTGVWEAVAAASLEIGPLLRDLRVGEYNANRLYILTHRAYLPQVVDAVKRWHPVGWDITVEAAAVRRWLGDGSHPDPAIVEAWW